MLTAARHHWLRCNTFAYAALQCFAWILAVWVTALWPLKSGWTVLNSSGPCQKHSKLTNIAHINTSINELEMIVPTGMDVNHCENSRSRVRVDRRVVPDE